MFKVGLTGGIGCGKTTVSRLFSEFNVPIIDADDIAHQLVQPGQPALIEICNTFGDQILQHDGSLDRAYLRDYVFSRPIQKQKLETILHPLVFSQMAEKISHLQSSYCIASIPLLFETNRTDFVDRILVVDCPIEMQKQRVKLRNSLTDERIQTIIDSQVSREHRVAQADDVLNNADSIDGLADQVKKLHNLYLTLSGSIG